MTRHAPPNLLRANRLTRLTTNNGTIAGTGGVAGVLAAALAIGGALAAGIAGTGGASAAPLSLDSFDTPAASVSINIAGPNYQPAGWLTAAHPQSLAGAPGRLVEAQYWNNIGVSGTALALKSLSLTTTGVATFADLGVKVSSFTSGNSTGYSNTTTTTPPTVNMGDTAGSYANGRLLWAYADDNNGTGRPNLTITGLAATFGAAASYHVYVFVSGDRAAHGSFKINGADYKGGDGTTVSGTGAWSGANSASPDPLVEGINGQFLHAVTAGDTLTVVANNDGGNNTARTPLAGVQIVSDPVNHAAYFWAGAAAGGTWDAAQPLWHKGDATGGADSSYGAGAAAGAPLLAGFDIGAANRAAFSVAATADATVLWLKSGTVALAPATAGATLLPALTTAGVDAAATLEITAPLGAAGVLPLVTGDGSLRLALPAGTTQKISNLANAGTVELAGGTLDCGTNSYAGKTLTATAPAAAPVVLKITANNGTNYNFNGTLAGSGAVAFSFDGTGGNKVYLPTASPAFTGTISGATRNKIVPTGDFSKATFDLDVAASVECDNNFTAGAIFVGNNTSTTAPYIWVNNGATFDIAGLADATTGAAPTTGALTRPAATGTLDFSLQHSTSSPMNGRITSSTGTFLIANHNTNGTVSVITGNTLADPANGKRLTVIKEGAGTLRFTVKDALALVTGGLVIREGVVDFTGTGSGASPNIQNLSDFNLVIEKDGKLITRYDGLLTPAVPVVIRGTFEVRRTNTLGPLILEGGDLESLDGYNASDWPAARLSGSVTVNPREGAATSHIRTTDTNAASNIALGLSYLNILGTTFTVNTGAVLDASTARFRDTAHVTTSGDIRPAFLEKAGEGRMLLGGANTYTGATRVLAGTLQITSAAALASTTGVSVTGGVLQLSAAGAAPKPVTIATGGALAPDSGIAHVLGADTAIAAGGALLIGYETGDADDADVEISAAAGKSLTLADGAVLAFNLGAAGTRSTARLGTGVTLPAAGGRLVLRLPANYAANPAAFGELRVTGTAAPATAAALANAEIENAPAGTQLLYSASGDYWFLAGSAPAFDAAPLGEGQFAAGETVTLSASATGGSGAPLTWQWFRLAFDGDGTPVALADGATGGGATISGATTATLVITSARTGDSALYYAVVTDQYGRAATSATAAVDIANTPIVITAQPADHTGVAPRAGVTFSVVVENAAGRALAYQWFKNDTAHPLADAAGTASAAAITGTTGDTLALTGVMPADEGEFFVVVSDAFGATATSSAASLRLNLPAFDFAAAGAPRDAAIRILGSATFAATLEYDGDAADLVFQWFKDGAPLADGTGTGNTRISGATTAALTLSAATLAAAGNYTLRVTDTFGRVRETSATLSFLLPEFPTNSATAQTVRAGSDAVFTVSLVNAPETTGTGGDAANGVAWQWMRTIT
ncbi:MAG: autotransporter-associated beta strand repeat-containing protein, partial [Puniceicoccales bacterium]|nr:autotransporter-associated beta strand repeat-containing protein [Puniceicoccales bacterium]